MNDMKINKKRVSIDLDNEVVEKYARGTTDFNTSKIKHKSLRLTLQTEQAKVVDAAKQTAATEILLPAENGFIKTESNEKIYKLTQRDIKQNVDINTARNSFDLQLQSFGPYNTNYSRNGRYLLMGGRKGHVAVLDCISMQVGLELHLQEEVHDVHYLHNESMFAVAQHDCTYIYDSKGIEIHAMRDHNKPYKLGYLPYHYLLVSTGHTGWIRWQDISTGVAVAGYSTGHGPCNVLKHNNHNSVSHVGHRNGVVSLWSPSSAKALISIFCHKSAISDVAIDRSGTYMVTAGYDGYLKIWDLRTYRSIHGYKLDQPASSLDISDTGLLAMGTGRRIQVLKDPYSKPNGQTYLTHEIRTPNAKLSSGGGVTARINALKSSVLISCVKFRPLEDILCAGHSHGVTTVIIPGAGESNFDAYEANPFQSLKQRREFEVQTLLSKLSPDMIGLDTKLVGSIDKDKDILQKEHSELFKQANQTMKSVKEKKKSRGKNKIAKRLRRRQQNVIDDQTLKLKEKLQQERSEQSKNQSSNVVDIAANSFDPLSRFAKKK